MTMYVLLLLLFFMPSQAPAQMVGISWSWISEIEESGFDLERAPGGCIDWTVIGVFPANQMETQDIRVSGNCYRVRAFDATRYYPYSNVAIVPAPADTTKPSVLITQPPNNSTVLRRSTVTIQSTFSDDVGVVQVRYLVNGTQLNCGVLATSCNWSVPNPPNKKYVIRVTATDQAGNVGEHQVSVSTGTATAAKGG